MIQENREILLNDLCGRLLHGVKILDMPANVVGDLFLVSTTDTVEYETKEGTGIQTLYNIKPYLRSMSSMTEEEKEYCGDLILHAEDWMSYYDYLDSRHLDYRGLIEKGLALEAPTDMYKNE